MANRKVICKPHPLSEVTEGPVLVGPDNAAIDLPDGQTKPMIDLTPGEFICTFSGGPPFEVITNEIHVEA